MINPEFFVPKILALGAYVRFRAKQGCPCGFRQLCRAQVSRNSAQIPEIPAPFQGQILKRQILKTGFGGSNHATQADGKYTCSIERRLLNSIVPIVRVIATTGCLQLSEQNKDQQDYDHESKSAAAIIAGAIEWTATNAAEAPEQGDDQNDQYYGSD
jgi:hypothetical protein